MPRGEVVFLPKSRYVELIKAERELHDLLKKHSVEEGKLIDTLNGIGKLIQSTQSVQSKGEQTEDITKKLDEIKRMIRNVSFVGSGVSTASPDERVEIEEIEEGEINLEMDDEDMDVLLGD